MASAEEAGTLRPEGGGIRSQASAGLGGGDERPDFACRSFAPVSWGRARGPRDGVSEPLFGSGRLTDGGAGAPVAGGPEASWTLHRPRSRGRTRGSSRLGGLGSPERRAEGGAAAESVGEAGWARRGRGGPGFVPGRPAAGGAGVPAWGRSGGAASALRARGSAQLASPAGSSSAPARRGCEGAGAENISPRLVWGVFTWEPVRRAVLGVRRGRGEGAASARSGKGRSRGSLFE